MPLSLAPFDVAIAGIAAVALLYLLVRQMSVTRAAWLGYAFGLGRYGLGVSWVYVSIHDYGAAPPWLAGLIVLLFAGGLATFDALAVLLWRRFCAPDGVSGAASFAAVWSLREWTLTWLATGFPWLLLGYGHLQTPLAGLAPVFGVLGVGFAAALTGVLLVAALVPLAPPATRWRMLGALAALWLLGGALREVDWVRPVGSIDVALVQGNIPQSTKWQPGEAQRIVDVYAGLTEPHYGSDLIVWPEAAVTVLLDAAGPLLDVLRARVDAAGGGALITGIVGTTRVGTTRLDPQADRGTVGYQNLLVVAGHDQRYAKTRLVPFGEYVPMESVLRGLIGFFDLPMSHTHPGADDQAPLVAAGRRIGAAICYEIAYGHRMRRQAAGADLLLTVSNDTWFGTSIGPLQHAQMARMRAVEFGRDLLRATNNGVTAVIAADGSLRASLPQFVPGVLTATATLHTGVTPYLHLGDIAIVIVALAVLAPAAWRHRRRT